MAEQTFMPLCKAIEQASGFRPHLTTALRWCTRGARGRKLRSVLLGGRRMTTVEAVLDFMHVDQTTDVDLEKPADRSNAIGKAKAQLTRIIKGKRIKKDQAPSFTLSNQSDKSE